MLAPFKTPYNVPSLIANLRDLGVKAGDAVMLNADLGNIAWRASPASVKTAVIESLLQATGQGGGFMTVAFSKKYLLWNAKRGTEFTRDTPTNAGAMAKAMLQHPGAIRSKHPTHSFVAIGDIAADLLDGHDTNAGTYTPIGRVVDRNGTLLLLGCADRKNGVQTIHLCQEQLGLSRKSLLSFGLLAARYFDEDGRSRLFRYRSIGGCSRGFHKLYGDFVTAGLLKTGFYGNGYSVSVQARPAQALTMEILRENPCRALCDLPDCLFCRGMWTYNIAGMPRFYSSLVLSKIIGILKK